MPPAPRAAASSRRACITPEAAVLIDSGVIQTVLAHPEPERLVALRIEICGIFDDLLRQVGTETDCIRCGHCIWEVHLANGCTVRIGLTGAPHTARCQEDSRPLIEATHKALNDDPEDPASRIAEAIADQVERLLRLIGTPAKCATCGRTIYWLQHDHKTRVPYSRHGIRHYEDSPECAAKKTRKK